MANKNFDLFNIGPVVVFKWKNKKGCPVEHVSNNIKDIYGYEVEDFLSNKLSYAKLVHQDDIQKVDFEIQKACKTLKEKSIIHTPYRFLDAEGQYRWIKDTTKLVIKNGEITHFIGYIYDITEEIELKKTKTAISSLNDGIWDWDVTTNNTYYTSSWKEMLGYNDDEISSSYFEWESRIHLDEKKSVLKKFQKFLDNKEIEEFECEYRLRCKNGTYKWIQDKAIILEYTKDKKPKRVIGTTKDISKKKSYELELISQELKFTNMFDNHSLVMLLVNPTNKDIVDANRSALNFYGYKQKDIKNMNIEDLVYKKTPKKIFGTKHILKSNEIRSVEVHSSFISTKKGTLHFLIIQDITSKKKLKKNIIKEKNFVSTLIESANSIITVIDKNGKMIRLNKYGQDFVGYNIKEIKKEPFFWKKFLPSKIQNRIEKVFEMLKKGEIAPYYRNAWISKSGEKRFFEWSNTIVRDKKGRIDYLLSIGIDITQQEKQKKKLLQQKEEFKTIFENAKDGIAIVDLNSNFLDFNTAFMQITGYSREELLKKSSWDLTIDSEKKILKEDIKRVLKKGYVQNHQTSYLNKKGDTVILNKSSSLLPDRKRVLITLKDVTQNKIFEEQSKLASMGEMIGNIAHQWRQPLSIISTVASNLKLYETINQPLDSKELIKNMETIIEQTMYLSKTIDDFRNFIKDDNKKEEITIQKIINKTLMIVKPSLSNNNISIITDFQSDLEITAYTNEIIQALINIINNSKDAINHHIKPNQDRYIFINTKKQKDEFIIEIKDNGGGADEKIIDKIFEPYFTTKHQSLGTGIGLSMTYKILTEHHNCKITVFNEEFNYENKKFKGLTFRITFYPPPI